MCAETEWDLIQDDAKKADSARQPSRASMANVTSGKAPHRTAEKWKGRARFSESDFTGGRYDSGHRTGSVRF